MQWPSNTFLLLDPISCLCLRIWLRMLRLRGRRPWGSPLKAQPCDKHLLSLVAEEPCAMLIDRYLEL